ncbi:MAG: hypothetical protein HQK50_09015 [Oligoflexia bacterium]|nr:hypothetical protein [Oligoflexia bacterium]
MKKKFSTLLLLSLYQMPMADAGMAIDGNGAFGKVTVGQNKIVQFTIRNTGSTYLKNITIPSIAAPWSYVSTTCTTTLASYKSCALNVKFAPTVVRSYASTVKVRFKQSSISYVSNKAVTGEGITSGPPPVGKCYLGNSIPAEYAVFSPTSPWNKVIPDNPELSPYSVAIMNNLMGYTSGVSSNINLWTAPMHVIDSRYCPRKNVYSIDMDGLFFETVDPDENGIVENVPMPVEAWADPTEDGHMILLDVSERVVYELGAARKRSDGHWEAQSMDKWALDGEGYRAAFSGKYWWKSGVRGAGVPFIGGLIRPEEIAAGVIRHTLAVSTPINQLQEVGNGGWGRWELCSPVASNTDAGRVGTQYIPEGAQIQLNPALNLDTLGLSPAAKVVAVALQRYGAFVVDNGPELITYFQNLGSSPNAWDPYLAQLGDLRKIPLSQFRVLKCNKKILQLK